MSTSEIVLGVVQTALTLVPVPGLAFAFSTLKAIWDIVQTIKGYRSQMMALATYIAGLLCVLNEKYSIEMDLECSTLEALHSLSRLLEDVKAEFEKYTHYRTVVKFWKTDVPGMINDYRQQISGLMDILKVTALIDSQALQKQHERARTLDHQRLVSEMVTLKDNQQLIVDVLTEERAIKNGEGTADARATRIKENKDSVVGSELSTSLLECLNEQFPEQKSSIPFESPPAYVCDPQPPTHDYPPPVVLTGSKKHDINHDVWAGRQKMRNEAERHSMPDTKQFLNRGFFVAEPDHISGVKGMADSPPSVPMPFPQPFHGCAHAFNMTPIPQVDAAHHYVPRRRPVYNAYAGYRDQEV